MENSCVVLATLPLPLPLPLSLHVPKQILEMIKCTCAFTLLLIFPPRTSQMPRSASGQCQPDARRWSAAGVYRCAGTSTCGSPHLEIGLVCRFRPSQGSAAAETTRRSFRESGGGARGRGAAAGPQPAALLNYLSPVFPLPSCFFFFFGDE